MNAQHFVTVQETIEQLREQRDELLATLTKLENAARASRGGLYIDDYDAILGEARAAIAKVTG